MKLKLTIQSPVHIGNNNILSPYCDYIYDDNKVYIISHKKLENYFEKQKNMDELIDEFVKIINRKAKSNKEKFKLKDFFEVNSLEIKKFSERVLSTSEEIREEIHRVVINSDGKPYIPGSSIKGAIRTALIYTHMEDEGYNIENIRKGYIGEDIFGGFSKDVLKHLHISDTFSSDKRNDLEILRSVRFDLKQKKETIPILKEGIPVNSQFLFTLKSSGKRERNKLDSKFKYLIEDTNGEDEILSRINRFSLKSIRREIEELEKYARIELSNIIDFYNKLENQCLAYIKNNKGAVMRIGSGKTYYDNSIGLALKKYEIEEIFKRNKKVNTKLFPKTRTFTIRNGKIYSPLGWITIEK